MKECRFLSHEDNNRKTMEQEKRKGERRMGEGDGVGFPCSE